MTRFNLSIYYFIHNFLQNLRDFLQPLAQYLLRVFIFITPLLFIIIIYQQKSPPHLKMNLIFNSIFSFQLFLLEDFFVKDLIYYLLLFIVLLLLLY